MAKVTQNALTISTPRWLKDYGNRRTLVPGGGLINTAEFTPDSDGRITIENGTVLGRTTAEKEAGTGFGPAVFTVTPDDEFYILARDVVDALEDPYCTLVRHNSVIAENLLPQWGTASAEEKAKIRELYETIRDNS